MRLTCPECAAQYEIADGLIPPEGREVECSACGHGWRQPGAPTLVLTAEAAVEDDFEAGDDLPPSRKLPDPVFAILREEAERELSARAADRAGHRDPLDGDATPAWRRPMAGDADALPDPHALAASLQWEVPRRPGAEAYAIPQHPADATAPRGPAVTETAAPALRQRRAHDRAFAELPGRLESQPGAILPQSPVPPAPPGAPLGTEAAAIAARQRRAHDRGFLVAMLLAALLAGAYAAAPSLAERGEAGARLMEARAAADQGRLWLQARAESLTDGAIAGVQGLFDGG